MSTLRVHRFEVGEPDGGTLRVHRFEVETTVVAGPSILRLTRFEVETTLPLRANAGADLSERAPMSTVTLDGSLSSGDGDLTFEWSQESGTTVTLSSTSAERPTFTAPASEVGALMVFKLRVKDDSDEWSDYDSVTVAVDPQQHWRATDTGWVASALSAA